MILSGMDRTNDPSSLQGVISLSVNTKTLKVVFHRSALCGIAIFILFICILLYIIFLFLITPFPLFVMRRCVFSHINRRTQFENPVLEAKRRLEQQRQIQSQGLSALPLPTIYRGTHGICAVLNQNMLTCRVAQLRQCRECTNDVCGA